jgi:putative CocE/NonD family hydrolase
MTSSKCLRAITLPSLLFASLLFGSSAAAQAPPSSNSETSNSQTLPSEMPAQLEPVTDSFDYTRREVMIPMRDGTKLHTVILIPKGAKNAPILLTRTPYNATELTSHSYSSHLGPSLNGYDNALEVILEGGYIRVVQDVRGKYGSEGDYVMNRPLHGPLNPTAVDHATDTYDTIDWLVKNIPESNGKVGILGISYDGFLPLMALINPHPALKVAVPMNPMVDGWMGDDWFHNGAFRELNMPYIYEQEGSRKNEQHWWSSNYDDYDMYLQAGSAGELGRRRGLQQVGFWNKLLAHPTYDSFWQQQAMDKIVAAQPLKVPTMIVHSLWDQEDIYGAPAVYKALKPEDTGNNMVFLVMGPWHHGGEIGDGSSLGAVKFGSDTGLYFRREILAPFLAQYLKDGASKSDTATVTAFETGTNTWHRLSSWPSGCPSGCTVRRTPLYLNAGLKLSFTAPAAANQAAFDEYISDPAKPVPFSGRPSHPMGFANNVPWANWLVDDQREVSSRPDVLVVVSDTLTSPMKISGQPIANLIASTSGTDSDWVVKLIDLYPDEVGAQEEMGGYQLMISADIFRGRYRESLETPKAIAADTPLPYHFALPNANHVFLPGHRIMVQIQSTWFPLYDRNPQTFVPNIFLAKPSDYRKATQRIYHAPGQATFIDLPLVATP